ncbi:MAG: glycosyltransferase family 9 protein [Candidatus Hydrothermales bacterium]
MNFLLFRTDKIGDLVLSLSVPQGIKRKYKDSKILFVCNPLYKEIIYNHPDIDKIIEFNNFRETLDLIKKEKIDISVHIFPRLKEALLSFLLKIPKRIGTAYRWYSFLFNKRVPLHRKKCEFHESYYNVLLLKKAGYDIEYTEPRLYLKEEEIEKVKENFKSYKKPFIIIHPESKGSAPNWSYEKYNELLKALKIDGTIFITGITKNFKFIEKKNIVDLRGKLNLRELMALISTSNLVFAPSTGVIHIASALNVKTVSIFSDKKPYTPTRWGPLGKSEVIKVKDENLEKISVYEVKEVILSQLKC